MSRYHRNVVVLDAVKGFRLRDADDDAMGSAASSGSQLFTGIDWLPWNLGQRASSSEEHLKALSSLDPPDDDTLEIPSSLDPPSDIILEVSSSAESLSTTPSPHRKPTKMSKQERKQARMDKKISASRNRKLKRLLDTEQAVDIPVFDHEINPYVIKTKINQIKDDILRNGPSGSADFKILQYHGIALYKSDIEQLCPGQWLNDNNIAFMYELIDQEMLRKTLLERTPFSKQVVLIPPAVVQLFLHYPDASAAATFLPSAEIEGLRFVFLPINFGEASGGWTDTGQGDHWLLAVWLVLELKLYFYDSMDLGIGHDEENAILTQLAKRLSLCTAIASNGSPIIVERRPCCQQRNSDDCGVHVVINTCMLLARILIHDGSPGKVDLDIAKVNTHALAARQAMIELVRYVTDKLKLT